MMIRSFLTAAVLLGMATFASAATIGYSVGLSYQTSYDAAGTELSPLVNTAVVQGDGTTKTTITLDGTATVHAFKVLLTANNLASDQDLLFFQYKGVATGGATISDGGIMGGSYLPSDFSMVTVNPPAMPTTSGSNAASAAPWNLNFANVSADMKSATFVHDVTTGSTNTGNGNGTYGDYAAHIYGTTAAFGGVGELDPYDIGTIYLTDADVAGTFGFQFVNDGGSFKIINGNTNGLGNGPIPANPIAGTVGYPTTYTASGDSVEFVAVPEPSTMALLLTGVLGLVGCCWRKRK